MRVLFLLLLFCQPSQHWAATANSTCNDETQLRFTSGNEAKFPVQDKEEPSALARASVWLFIGVFVIVAIGRQLPFFPVLILAGMLGSIALAIYVLCTEKSKKSRKIARIMLGIHGIILGTVILLTLLLNAYQRSQG